MCTASILIGSAWASMHFSVTGACPQFATLPQSTVSLGSNVGMACISRIRQRARPWKPESWSLLRSSRIHAVVHTTTLTSTCLPLHKLEGSFKSHIMNGNNWVWVCVYVCVCWEGAVKTINKTLVKIYPPGGEPTIFRPTGGNSNHYTTNPVLETLISTDHVNGKSGSVCSKLILLIHSVLNVYFSCVAEIQ